MSLLELAGVHKRSAEEAGARPILRDVSLRIEPGELVVVWGLRRSGRSTLLRVAAGIEPPDSGAVRFDGHDLALRGERLLGGQIGYVQKTLRFADGQTALDHAVVGLLARWISPTAARARALRALERTGAGGCADMTQREFTSTEAVRVALARTLTLKPRLVMIDEPVKGVELIDRDPLLSLLRSLADEGIAILSSTGESTGLSEADRGLVLGDGELRGAPAPRLARVLPLFGEEERRVSG